jgi:hypothetical protein
VNSELPLRHFEFNHIYIIDSLGTDELHTAGDLYNDIVRRRFMQLPFGQSEHLHVSNKQQFLYVLSKIESKVRSGGHYPFLHLEIHGNPQGLVLLSEESITWGELTDSFRIINELLRNNLFLSMATCHSGHIISSILPSKPAPFFACIATWDELTGEDIMASFQSFFDYILNVKLPERINLNAAVKILNGSPERPWRYHLYNSELLFERVFAEYENDIWNPRKFSERVKGIVNRIFASGKKIRWSKNKVRREVQAKLIADRHRQKAAYKRRFLILDA